MDKYIAFVLICVMATASNAVDLLDDEDLPVNYTGCQLLRITPLVADDPDWINFTFWKTLYNDDVPGVSVWSGPIDGFHDANVQVCPEAKDELLENLSNENLNATVLIEDLQKVIDEQKQYLELVGRSPRVIDEQKQYLELVGRFEKSEGLEKFGLDRYHNLTEIYDFLDVAANHSRNLMTVVKIGSTLQAREIKMAKLGYDIPSVTKPAIWLDFGIHSREWVTIAASLYMIHHMITSNDSETTSLLKTFDWYIVPVVNPDGYVYSWTSNRLWRKNRSINRAGCYGVDLNRNFDIDFYGGMSSFAIPCSNQYRGSKAFSENETLAVRDQVLKLGNNLKAFVSVHSYSQLWLLPYGYKKEKPKDYLDMHAVAKIATESLAKMHGIHYKLGSISEMLYRTSGNSLDWAYDVPKVKYSFGIEMRDKGEFGFLLPAGQIVPAAQELLAALSRMALEIAKREKFE